MNSSTTSATASWQSKVAYGAALLFTFTSASTNALYGFSKGADLPTSLIWLTVSVAASIVFALSVPALLHSISAKKVAQSLLVCVGLITCGTYSVVAALGSASGGRQDAAVAESTLKSARSRAQATYDKATAELEAIKPARSVAEMEALIAGAKPVCRIVVAHGYRDTVCNPPPVLTAELARAKRRAELEQKIEAARLQLAAPATRQANSDAVAISAYLSALGWTVEPDTLNPLLALLAVLVIELGGGASLAIGMALGEIGVRRQQSEQAAGVNGQAERPLSELATERPNATPERGVEIASQVNTIARSPALNERLARPAHERVLSALRAKDGVLFGSQGALGASFGWSKTRMNEVLHELEAAGRVRLSASRQGTAVRLVGTA